MYNHHENKKPFRLMKRRRSCPMPIRFIMHVLGPPRKLCRLLCFFKFSTITTTRLASQGLRINVPPFYLNF